MEEKRPRLPSSASIMHSPVVAAESCETKLDTRIELGYLSAPLEFVNDWSREPGV
jgi:hypothetical protein